MCIRLPRLKGESHRNVGSYDLCDTAVTSGKRKLGRVRRVCKGAEARENSACMKTAGQYYSPTQMSTRFLRLFFPLCLTHHQKPILCLEIIKQNLLHRFE